FLKDVWPSQREIADALARAIRPEMYRHAYGQAYAGDERWRALAAPAGSRFAWDPGSSYVRLPTYFDGMTEAPPAETRPIVGARGSIYDAAMRYQAEGTPLIVLAGKEYGSGSSRDWAAKGPALQGVRAVIAESYERIHRSNLVGMGIVPLQFTGGDSVATLGLT